MASMLVVCVVICICMSRVICLRSQRTNAISLCSSSNSMVSRDANLTSKHRSLRLYSNSYTAVVANNEKKNGIYRLLSAISDYHVIIFNVLSLSALVIQNSGLTITMRLSRLGTKSELYSPNTAVVLSELIKLVISVVVYFSVERKELSIRQMLRVVYSDKSTLLKTSIPSTLYVLQNNLQYLATSNLPAEIYQVLIQMKLITTALLSSSVLKRTLSNAQWMSILMMFVGVAIVQLSLLQKSSAIPNFNPVVGITAVLVSCVTSGFAGVYNEKLLKDDSTSLWARNVQLSTISFLLSVFLCFADRVNIFERGFFYGYSPLVLSVVLLQALGGIIVSIVVKNTGSIVKGFATSGSIVLSCIISIFLFNEMTMNAQFLVGTLLVVMSTFAYSFFSTRVAAITQ